MVDVRHLATPVHVRVPELLLASANPGAPDRRLLLCDPDQDHLARATFPGRRLDQGSGDGLFVLALLEVPDRDALGLGPALYRLYVTPADLSESGRRRDLVAPLPVEEDADQPDRLQLGHVGLQEDAVDRSHSQGHLVAEQHRIIGHSEPPRLATRRLSRGGTSGRPRRSQPLGGMRLLATSRTGRSRQTCSIAALAT